MTNPRLFAAAWLRSAALAVSAAAAAFSAHAQLNLSPVPAFLPTPLAPNIVLTLDDSGSMRSAFVPDNLCNNNSGNTNANSRRFKSSAFNALYYNPNIRYEPAKTDTGAYVPGAAVNTFTAALFNGFDASRGTLNLATSYLPTLSYNPALASGPTQATDCGGIGGGSHMYSENPAADFSGDETDGVAAYYYNYDPAGTGCSPAANTNDACYVRVTVGAASGPGTIDLNADGAINASDKDERQNFANWYAYYRTRNLMTATATSLAFADMPATARVGWQALNSCNTFASACTGWAGSTFDNRLRLFTGTHRANFFAWLSRLPSAGGTPLRAAASRAGEYFRNNSGVNSPWSEFPYDGSANPNREFACRPNFHVLMTDGLWNEGTGSFCSGSSCGNADAGSRTLPDGTSFSNSVNDAQVYRDGSSDSLSDVVFHYWATDLRTDLANKVLPYVVDRAGTPAQQYWNPRNDPATWQHLTTFTVGLGLTSTLSVSAPVDIRWGGSTFAAPGYPNLAATGTGNAPWPATGANATPGNVYDLWHAGINGRGAAFSAENPAQILTALQSALNRVLAVQSASAALASNTTRVSSDTQVFQARFNSGDWSGELRSFRINTDGTLGSQLWTTATAGSIPAAGSRNIVTWSGTAGISFDEVSLRAAGLWSGIAATPAAAIAGVSQAVLEDDFLQYVRGVQSKEQSAVGGMYRIRSTPLGDIVNSTPAYVGQTNFGYTALPEGRATASPYQTFFNSQATRTPMVYVGSNGGMLHGFDAATGVERFAYVPQAVLPFVKELTNPNYAHRYLVDGSPRVRDAYIGSNWRTVLIGTTGAARSVTNPMTGPKAIFALDVTTPTNTAVTGSPTTLGASNVLWEINTATPYQSTSDAADPDYANDLGFIVGQGVPIRLNSGDWAVIFGNGYNSTRHKAVLYIVRLSDGALLRKIDTDIGSSGSPNGLGTPALYDSNGDLIFDAAYAADMRGNVWKFDLSSSNPASWNIAFSSSGGFPNGTPLFQARSGSNQQPIEARVELVKPPAGFTGLMVVFGTGRLLAVGDNVDTTTQSFYGIWDNGTPVTTTNRSQLVQQTITQAFDTAVPPNVIGRSVSRNAVGLSSSTRGWYMDFPASLERVIGTGVIRNGRLLFTTVIPSTDPCDFGGSGWLMQVDARTGGALPFAGFDTNNDGVVNNGDNSAISGVTFSVGLVRSVSVLQGGGGGATDTALLSGSANNPTTPSIESRRVRGDIESGRNSWRQDR